MKVLVTGCTGQLGYDVCKELQKRNINYYAATRKDFDLVNQENSRTFIEQMRPDVLIHCAAYTAVDKAEDEGKLCQLINTEATHSLAKACRAIDATMIYISTDYVFGDNGTQFHETDDRQNPLNVYGKTKAAGEKAVTDTLDKYFIVRISWVFGINGNNFIKTMLRLAQNHIELKIVADQIGSPTYTADLAVLIRDMLASNHYGIYHATNEGICSWADFARAIFKEAHLPTRVIDQATADYPTKAVRPLNSRLSKNSLDKANFNRLPSWQNALQRYLKEISL